MPLSKLARRFRDRIPLRYQISDAAGKLSSFPRRSSPASLFFVYGRHRAASSVIAVSRADRSFIVLREGISQLAGLAWRQIAIANRRHD
jgi:hypothetical protein